MQLLSRPTPPGHPALSQFIFWSTWPSATPPCVASTLNSTIKRNANTWQRGHFVSPTPCWEESILVTMSTAGPHARFHLISSSNLSTETPRPQGSVCCVILCNRITRQRTHKMQMCVRCGSQWFALIIAFWYWLKSSAQSYSSLPPILASFCFSLWCMAFTFCSHLLTNMHWWQMTGRFPCWEKLHMFTSCNLCNFYFFARRTILGWGTSTRNYSSDGSSLTSHSRGS